MKWTDSVKLTEEASMKTKLKFKMILTIGGTICKGCNWDKTI